MSRQPRYQPRHLLTPGRAYLLTQSVAFWNQVRGEHRDVPGARAMPIKTTRAPGHQSEVGIGEYTFDTTTRRP